MGSPDGAGSYKEGALSAELAVGHTDQSPVAGPLGPRPERSTSLYIRFAGNNRAGPTRIAAIADNPPASARPIRRVSSSGPTYTPT